MLAKIVVLIFLLLIVYCLASALFYMLSTKKTPEMMAKALTWRITLSILLFLLLIVGFLLGWIHPHGV